ncbi:MAG: Cardiolipin synthetase [Verrucomicrobiaceae bacterium]|nr:Cardiolipin synthetase [Verrucomicrobiaceae bacterium]
MSLLHIHLPPFWRWILAIVELVSVVAALLHVLLRKKDPRAAAYWVALIILVPLLGPVLYLLLGINIIRRSGRRYRDAVPIDSQGRLSSYVASLLPEWETEVQSMPGLVTSLNTLSRMSLVGGNAVAVLRNGTEVMPAMLEAIDGATTSVSLLSYIFEVKGVGLRFVEALERAVKRGVKVRVMIDDAGTRYAWPPVTGELSRRGITVRRFMPIRFIGRLLTMNLRNHRKIMVVDGRVGFTGGVNIRQGNMLEEHPEHPVQDLHFRVQGPVVMQMQQAFGEDWQFCTGEVLEGKEWYPELEMPGDVSAIGLPDGPDDDTQTISFAIATALHEAKREVRVMTPYFLPPEPIFSALIACALRGVKVRILLPSENNIPMVKWASRTMYAPLLRHGCRFFESAPPFDHSKALVIDGIFTLIGSTNWDPRSLQLNFEFNLACFDDKLARILTAEFDRKRATATEVTMETLAAQSVGEQLRNGVARLLIPLL